MFRHITVCSSGRTDYITVSVLFEESFIVLPKRIKLRSNKHQTEHKPPKFAKAEIRRGFSDVE